MREILERALPTGERLRLLVVGDLILDESLRGNAERLSPEAPVPALRLRGSELFPGGAGNVAANLATLGCEVHVAGVVGNDDHGRRLLDLLSERGISTDGIHTAPGRPTTHKLRVLAEGRQVVRVDLETRAPVDTALAAALRAEVERQVGEVDAVICSDYRKGALTPELLATVVRAAHAAGKPVVVDPKGEDYGRYRGVDVLTPNLDELRIATGVAPDTSEARRDAVGRLFEQTDARAVLLTCGKEGMVLYEGDREPVPVPAQAREVFDVTGAGDTVAAVMGLGVAAGLPLLAAARLANHAAGIIVGRLGTATVGRDELIEDVLQRGPSAVSKVVDVHEAVAAVRRARTAAQRIVFTNGCFDLLHAGHVELLETAHTFGDFLVVGLNSDASMRGLKGEGRPLVPQEDRARIVAGLSSVDRVVLFDEPTPAELVRALLPDVLVKGSDYADEVVVGRDTVESRGGRVELVPLLPGRSTSNLVAKLRGDGETN